MRHGVTGGPTSTTCLKLLEACASKETALLFLYCIVKQQKLCYGELVRCGDFKCVAQDCHSIYISPIRIGPRRKKSCDNFSTVRNSSHMQRRVPSATGRGIHLREPLFKQTRHVGISFPSCPCEGGSLPAATCYRKDLDPTPRCAALL